MHNFGHRFDSLPFCHLLQLGASASGITRAGGNTVSLLTMDKSYQVVNFPLPPLCVGFVYALNLQARRAAELRKDKVDNLGDGLVSGGRHLVEGVFQGVTGLVTAPVEGAQQGFGGVIGWN